ncbi:MAG: glycosyltransferase family 2 protein [Pseudomonadota bacterium]
MISVVMVTYHTGAILWESLASALDAEGVSEVVVVDNGNPAEVTEKLLAMSRENARLSVITGHGNEGFGRACNRGAASARGEYFLFLNPDALLPKAGAVELLRCGQEDGSDDWAAGPRLDNPDGTEQQGSRRAILTPWNAFVEASRAYRLMPNHPYFKRFNDHEAAPLAEPTAVPCLSGAAFLVPRSTWEKLGGFDPRFFLHVEDVDFFVRLSKAGGRAIFVPSARVVHHKSSSEVDPLFVERRKKQSLNLYFATHFKDVYPPGFLTLLRGMLWVSFAFRSVAHRVKSVR